MIPYAETNVPVPKQREIPLAISMLEDEVVRLAEQLEILESRLYPVLKPGNLNAAGDSGGGDRPESVPLVVHLAKIEQRIYELSNTVRALITRLEL
jgi:hypothetical protein